MLVVGDDVNANGMVALNFSYSLDNPSSSCRNNVTTLINDDVLKIANNTCIKNAEIYLGYQIQAKVLQVGDWAKQVFDFVFVGVDWFEWFS